MQKKNSRNNRAPAFCLALALACIISFTGCALGNDEAGEDSTSNDSVVAKEAYDAGYYAGRVDGASASTTFSGIVYEVTAVDCVAGATASGKTDTSIVVLSLKATNVSKNNEIASFTGHQISVKQVDNKLIPSIDAEGIGEAAAQELSPGESCSGWIVFLLDDEKSPICIEQDDELFYGLINPQTVEIS